MEAIDVSMFGLEPAPLAAGRRGLEALIRHVTTARHATEVMCGLASELQVYPQFERLSGIQPFHSRGLVPLSYHILDAMGTLHMLQAGLVRRSIWVLLTACLENAAMRLSEMEAPLTEMRTAAARTEAAEQVAAVERWTRHCALAVRRAQEALRAVLGAEFSPIDALAREYSLRSYSASGAGRADPAESAS